MVFGQVLSVMEFLLVAIVKLVGWEMQREYCGKQIVHSLLSLDYYSVPFLCCNEMAINIQGSPFSRRQSVGNNFTWLQEMSSSTRNTHCNSSRTKGLNVQSIYTNSTIFTKSLIKYSKIWVSNFTQYKSMHLNYTFGPLGLFRINGNLPYYL